MRKHIGRRAAGAVVVMLAFVSLGVAGALPVAAAAPKPHQLYGRVTLGSSAAPAETVVSARIAGTEFASTVTDSSARYGWYPQFKAPADDPDTPGKEGGVAGDILQLYVAGVLSTSVTFQYGAVAKLDLVGSLAPTPTPTRTPSPTPSPTPKPTPTSTPSPTLTPQPTATPAPTGTPTPKPSPTSGPAPLPTSTLTPAPTATPTSAPAPPTASPLVSLLAEVTPVATALAVVVRSPAPQITPTALALPTPTAALRAGSGVPAGPALALAAMGATIVLAAGFGLAGRYRARGQGKAPRSGGVPREHSQEMRGGA